MSKPESFILNSDYATLKNDATGTMSLSITTGDVIAVGGSKTFETFLDIGTRNASIRAQMSSNRYVSNYCVGTSLQTQIQMQYDIPGSPMIFDDYFVANVERVSPTRLRLYLTIPNPNTFTLTVIGGAQVITADINTFLSPFA
jgi:hypothetical protein